jgi:hypothetical protein
MSSRKDEKWLDDQLQRAVDGATPVFDAEAWKRKYAAEFQTLLGRGRPSVGCGPHSHPQESGGVHSTPNIRVFRGSVVKLAFAAAVLVGAGLLLLGRFRLGPEEPPGHPQQAVGQTPAQMVSMIALSTAFRRGGMEALDQQCERALKKLGPRPNSVSMQELLKDMDSMGKERMNI